MDDRPQTGELAADAADEGSLIGEVLDGRYEVERSLDRGGMATVYLAFDRQLQRRVVVKIPHARLMADRSFRQRFLQEIRDLATHEHPAILRIEASGEHGDQPYAVMQYLGGGNLGERIHAQGGQQSRDEIMAWLPRVAEALDFVHRQGSLHRDVKPANILFDERGHAYLSDFGIATAIGAADPDAPTQELQRELTVVGTFVGSPAYAPPEAIDRLLTPAYDQYSLATVVYLALAGELPFQGTTNEAILIAKEKQEPPRLRRRGLKGRLDRSAERAVLKALSREPGQRFDSCQAFVEAFAAEGAGARRHGLGPALRLAAGVAVGIAGLLFLARLIGGVGSWGEDRALVAAPPVSGFPVSVTLGSRPEEIDRAIELCRKGGGGDRACARSVFADERLRTVTFPAPFALDRAEVTNEEFAAFVEATDYETTAERRGYSWDVTPCRGCSWRTIRDGRRAEDHPRDPVVHVSLADARAYCKERGARLPTEDEWELTARGVERRTFPWGDAWDASRLRTTVSSAVGLEPVGSYPRGATPEGVEDLAGSVWEWTSTESGAGERRIFKGGSWMTPIPAYFRAAAFSENEPDFSSIDLGFRCAQDL